MSMMQKYIMAARVGKRKRRPVDPFQVLIFVVLLVVVALMAAGAV